MDVPLRIINLVWMVKKIKLTFWQKTIWIATLRTIDGFVHIVQLLNFFLMAL